MIKTKVRVTFPNAKTLINQLGFNRGQKVQTFIDNEFMRGNDDYVPKDTGNTRDSVYKNYAKGKQGAGYLIWDVYGYENGTNTWNDTTSIRQDAPMRGAFWALRFWNNGGKEKVIKATNEYIKSLK